MAGIGEKAIVTIIRKWNSPVIHVWASDEEIGMQMDLSDFVIALSEEIGNPATLLTKKQLLKALQTATATVESNIKEKSSALF